MFETRRRSSRWILQILATLMVAPFIYPLVYMVQGSLVGGGLNNYRVVLSQKELPYFFRNSLIIAACTLVLVYICTMCAAFGFAKLRVKARELWFWLLLICMTLPEVVLLTPLFVTTMRMGIYNTYLAVILPMAALQIPFAVLLARTFVEGIPSELVDAARVDGAGAMKIFFFVMVPLTRPIASAVLVLTLITCWNNYLLPLVLLTDPSSQTITMLPQYFIGQFTYDLTKVLAASVICALPMVVAYISMQRMFERGLAAGALK